MRLIGAAAGGRHRAVRLPRAILVTIALGIVAPVRAEAAPSPAPADDARPDPPGAGAEPDDGEALEEEVTQAPAEDVDPEVPVEEAPADGDADLPSGPDLPAVDLQAEAATDAFGARARSRIDPYGRRPEGVPRLNLEQIVVYTLDNPAVLAAEEKVEAMKAQLKKARFAWIPVIETTTSLTPGARVRCEDLKLDDGTTDGFDFQYCFSRRDPNFDINTVQDYFKQLSEAGVRVEFEAKTIIPITTFGKLLNLKRAAQVKLAIDKLEKLQVEQESVLRVYQAYSSLLAAREAIAILREAKNVVDGALERVQADLGGGEDDWDTELGETNPDRDPDDLYKVKLADIDLEQKMREALKVEALALSALWALAGEAAPRGFDVADERLAAWKVKGGLDDLEDYKRLAIVNRPEARMASAAVKAREYQERLARANFLPDLGVALRFAYARSTAADMAMSQLYYQDGFNYSRFSAVLALRWKFDFHFKAFDLQAARATKRSQAYQAEAAALLLGRDVTEAYHELVEATHLIATYREAVDLAWKLVVSAQQKDAVGGGDAGELLRALEKWYRQRFELTKAIQSRNEAVARLSRAVGEQLAVTDSGTADTSPSQVPQDGESARP